MDEESGFDSQVGQEISLFFIAARLTLGHSHPHTNGHWRLLPPQVKQLGHTDHHLFCIHGKFSPDINSYVSSSVIIGHLPKH
jgi:hypothetical protein